MAGYFLIDVEWTDDRAKTRYVQGVGDTVDAHGGVFRASTPEVEVMEGDWPLKNRLVLLRFPTAESARQWYHSEQYEPLHRIREQSANSKIIFFEGD